MSSTKGKRTKRVVISLAVIVIISSFAVLSYALTYQEPFTFGQLQIEIVADKPHYIKDENVTFSIYVTNNQSQSIAYPSEVAYRISKDNSVVAEPWHVNINFARVPVFHAHSRTLYDTFVWNQETQDKHLESGNYTFAVVFGSGVNNEGSCEFEIH